MTDPRADLDDLKRALDEDRLSSGRSLFPTDPRAALAEALRVNRQASNRWLVPLVISDLAAAGYVIVNRDILAAALRAAFPYESWHSADEAAAIFAALSGEVTDEQAADEMNHNPSFDGSDPAGGTE